MPTKHYTSAVAALRDLGYEAIREKRGATVLRRGDHSLTLPYAIGDTQAGHAVHNAQKRWGAPTKKDAKKANPSQVRVRRAAERDRLRLENERDRATHAAKVAELGRELDGRAAEITRAEIRQLIQAIERRERELRGLEAQMTSVPGARADAGRPKARHRS